MKMWMVAAVLAVGVGTAHADKQLDDLRTMYKKEAAGCTRSRDGLVKVVDGATELAKSIAEAEKADLDKDLATLTKGLETVKAYCAELDAVNGVLEANPTAKYKTLEKDLDERDNKIRKLRAASKKILASTEPITRKLVPKINAARVSAPAPAPEKRTPAKFPSGRTIDLPSLPGQWKVTGSTATDTAEYVEKTITATVQTRSFAHATCEQQRRVATTTDDANIADVEIAGDTKAFAWIVSFQRKGHAMQTGCVTVGDGGIVATFDLSVIDQPKLTAEMSKLLLRMAAARK
jgi:hypothetical protein